MEITLKPIATVKNKRTIPTDDFWEEIISEIELVDHIPTEALEGIAEFSHLEIIYFLKNRRPDKNLYTQKLRILKSVENPWS